MSIPLIVTKLRKFLSVKEFENKSGNSESP